MGKQGYLSAILRFLGAVALIDLGIFALVGLGCWLGGWRTASQYGTGLVWAGIGAMVLGVLSIVGNWGLTRSPTYQYGLSVGVQNIYERTQQAIKDAAQGYGFFILMAVAGVVSVATGSLIQAVFP
jgi:hypothetical protein